MVVAAVSFGSGCQRYVAADGSDSGTGSAQDPWATITHAADKVPDDDCTVWIADGVYREEVDIDRRFGTSLTVAATRRHGPILEGPGRVVSIDGARNVTFDGFQVRHRPGGTGIVFNVSGSGNTFAEGITVINNIIYDSYDNDLVKINAGVRDTVIANTITFNPGPGEQHYDINGVEDVTLRNNIMFNDYAGSGRPVEEVKQFIIMKDSNSSGLDLRGSKRLRIDGNVFIGWENRGGEFMVKAGNDGKAYHEAIDVIVENNLFLSNGPDEARAVFGGAGVKNVTFRNNTVSHTTADYQGYVFEVKGANPQNQNITVCNNVWSAEMNDFSKISGTSGLSERANIYWNGGAPIPDFSSNKGSVADPGLEPASAIRPRAGDPSALLRALVAKHGTPNDVVVDVADPDCASNHDILGRARGAAPDVGAVELGSSPPSSTTTSSTTTSSTTTSTSTTVTTSAAPPVPNTPPVVEAGADFSVMLNESATLRGEVHDDGLPDPPSAISMKWRKVSGPGSVVFGDPRSATTTATFSAPGSYMLSLRADDSDKVDRDYVAVEVLPVGESVHVELQVATSGNDAEELGSGRMVLDGDTLRVAHPKRFVGLRYEDVAIPRGAEIVRAYVEFSARPGSRTGTDVVIWGEATGDADPFRGERHAISSRDRTSDKVRWRVPGLISGSAGGRHQTADITSVIQEIFDSRRWAKGNALSLIFNAAGKLAIVSHEADPDLAPVLHIEYITTAP